MASTKPSTRAPITLIGNALGYSISEVSSVLRSQALRRLRTLVGLIEAPIDRPRLAAQRAVTHRLAVERGHRQHFLGGGAEQDLVGGEHIGLGNRAQVVGYALFLAQLAQ